MTQRPISVCFPFVGDEFGGSHLSAINLIKGLDRSRVNPLVCLHDPVGKLADILQGSGIDFIKAPEIRILTPKYRRAALSQVRFDGLAYVSEVIPRLRRFLLQQKVQIVHTNDGIIHTNWGVAARAAGAKLLWHHRGDPRARGVNFLAPIIANHIVAVSRFACPSRPILPIRRKLSVIHSPFDHAPAGVDRVLSRRTVIGELKCSSDTRLLAYFGVLIDRKRPLSFVDAVYHFTNRHPEIPVAGLLFGAPFPDGLKLEEAVKMRAEELRIADKIHLMGFKFPVEPWLAGVDVLLVPAINEPFGRTLIEAMLLGTPVVATDHGGNPEAIAQGVTGYLVEVERPEAFCDPVYKLLAEPACWKRISEAAQAYATGHFSSAAHVNSITSIYDRLISRNAPTPT